MRVAFGVLAVALALAACGPSNKTTAATSAAPAASAAPVLIGGYTDGPEGKSYRHSRLGGYRFWLVRIRAEMLSLLR